MPFLFGTDIVRLVCQFFIAVPGIESSHCVAFPVLWHSELYPRIAQNFQYCSTRHWSALWEPILLWYSVLNPRVVRHSQYLSTRNCSAHCVPFPILQYLALVRALYAYSRVVVLGIEESGRNAKIFHLCAPAALLGIPSLPFFDISKNLLCTNKRYQCVGALQSITAEACLLILRGFFRGLESVLAHSPKMLFRKITP